MRVLGIREPGGDIPGLEGTEREQEKDASEKEQQTRHFIP
jgi:hypothetical protein